MSKIWAVMGVACVLRVWSCVFAIKWVRTYADTHAMLASMQPPACAGVTSGYVLGRTGWQTQTFISVSMKTFRTSCQKYTKRNVACSTLSAPSRAQRQPERRHKSRRSPQSPRASINPALMLISLISSPATRGARSRSSAQ